MQNAHTVIHNKKKQPPTDTKIAIQVEKRRLRSYDGDVISCASEGKPQAQINGGETKHC